MTARTHDLAAVTLVTYRLLTWIPPLLTWESMLGMGVATILGGLFPDIDNISSQAWQHRLVPWEGKSTRDFLQGHRFLSHSILGGLIFTWAVGFLRYLKLADVDVGLVQQAFFLGFLSHLIMDSFTKQGAPWLFPIPVRFGIPPLAFLRIRSGSWTERLIVFPGLLLLIIWIFFSHQPQLTQIILNIR